MGKRYYCDYCDRTMPYSDDARKKHNAGHQHQLNRKMYYNSFKTLREKYADEIAKSKCKRFFTGQLCSYGDNCIFSHFTDARLDELKKAADEESSHCIVDVLDFSKQNSNRALHSGEELMADLIASYSNQNPLLEGHPNLPPSLQPFSINDLLDVTLPTWG